MIAVGEYILGPLEGHEIRMSTAFAGGIGGTTLENCGAFSAGVMIIGGLYGRESSEEDDQVCQGLAEKYRERFIDPRSVRVWRKNTGNGLSIILRP